MTSEQESWFLDQLTKSAFFHQKLHEWQLLEIADAIDRFPGEDLLWNLKALGISRVAWKRIIHRGIKPVAVFAHPEILMRVPGSTAYYRMLSMVSQKSMAQVGFPIERYESGSLVPGESVARGIARHLNRIISKLIEMDERVNAREFDLWRGMAAGTQAQGAWQNVKGAKSEEQVKGLIREQLRRRGRVKVRSKDRISLSDGRTVVFGDEPDVAVYKGKEIQAAVEVKGGIDPAGVLERLGAALKSLRRVREENPAAITILIIPRPSLTKRAMADLKLNRHVITHWFTLEDFLNNERVRAEVFELLGF